MGVGKGSPWSLSKALFSTCFVDCGAMNETDDILDDYGYGPPLPRATLAIYDLLDTLWTILEAI